MASFYLYRLSRSQHKASFYLFKQNQSQRKASLYLFKQNQSQRKALKKLNTIFAFPANFSSLFATTQWELFYSRSFLSQ